MTQAPLKHRGHAVDVLTSVVPHVQTLLSDSAFMDHSCSHFLNNWRLDYTKRKQHPEEVSLGWQKTKRPNTAAWSSTVSGGLMNDWRVHVCTWMQEHMSMWADIFQQVCTTLSTQHLWVIDALIYTWRHIYINQDCLCICEIRADKNKSWRISLRLKDWNFYPCFILKEYSTIQNLISDSDLNLVYVLKN